MGEGALADQPPQYLFTFNRPFPRSKSFFSVLSCQDSLFSFPFEKIRFPIDQPEREREMSETKPAPATQVEVEFAKCECCGLTEECTPAYITRVRERHHGRWICGLCAEAVVDEIGRAGRRISTEEALARHMTFSRDFRFRAESLQDPSESAEHLISAMRLLLRRSFESPRSMRSTPATPRGRRTEEEGADGVSRPPLARSGSCFPTIAG